METIIGTAAGFLTTVAAIPQLLKVVKSKSTHDISLLYFVTLVIGVGLWFVYGILIGDLPIMLTNGFTFLILFPIPLFKIKYK